MAINLGPYTFDTQGGADALAFIWTDPLGTGLQVANTARRWSHGTNDTASTGVGPTSGAGGNPDGYAYTEMSSPGAFNDVFTMELDTNFDCAANSNVTVKWKTNQRGEFNDATCQLQSNENGAGWVNRGSLFGGSGDPDKVATGGVQIWSQRSVDISALGVSHASTRARLVVTAPAAGTTWHSDYGIDEFEVLTSVFYKLDGITKDNAGTALGSCECHLFKDNLDDTSSFVAHLTSNVSTGAYSFTGLTDNDSQYFVVAWKDDAPHVFDVTDHNLQPVAE